jgi:hypothetical protein
MKTNLLAAAAALSVFGLTACSPSYPAAKKQEGLCAGVSCTVAGKPAEEFYSKFMSGTVGSCADQSTMAFTSMVSTTVLPKDAGGFAEIRLYLDKTGHYTGAYAEPVGAFGATNPATQGQLKLTKISGTFYLENDKIVIENVGIGRRQTDDEILVQPISSSPLSMTGTTLMAFEAAQSDTNEQGQTVAQVCAAQTPAPTVAPAPAPQPAPVEATPAQPAAPVTPPTDEAPAAPVPAPAQPPVTPPTTPPTATTPTADIDDPAL